MTALDFSAFLQQLGWSNYRAARELGCSRSSITAWQERGAPHYIELALMELARRRSGWAFDARTLSRVARQ
jgi:hypothetical protein